MKNSRFMLLRVVAHASIFISLFSFATQPAPLNQIQCTAGIFDFSSKIPTEDLQPFSFSLSANDENLVWQEQLEKINIQDYYKQFYTPFWIAPLNASKFSSKIILSREAVLNGSIHFSLSRFPESEKRVSGLSIEVSIPQGFYSAYLIDFKNDGYSKKISSPFKINGVPYYLLIDCQIEKLSIFL